jgi:putative ABC transport system permease protein
MKVCLLGQTVVDNLFGEMDPVGQIVRMKKFPFTVVGVLSIKGQTTWGQDQDDVVYVPLTTGQRLLFGQQFPGMVGAISVQATGPDMLKLAEEQIIQLLRQRHRLRANQDNDFSVRNLTEAFSTAEESARVMSILLGAIASISLLVGGIGIMNIMLVSVTERTREIGIRMAVGARGSDILWQFLVEALALSLIGGIIGIILGVGASQLISQFFKWPTLISPQALILSFSFAGGVGIFFGFYPARKAAQMDPIEALRYE